MIFFTFVFFLFLAGIIIGPITFEEFNLNLKKEQFESQCNFYYKNEIGPISEHEYKFRINLI